MPFKDPAARKAYNKKYNAAWSKRNRPKKLAAYKKHFREGPERAKRLKAARNSYFVSKYGLTLTQVEAMKKSQGNKCGICKKPSKELVVDHCHVTQEVRGMLCHPCNRWLGIYEKLKTASQFEDYLGGVK